jgi:hypothetical protein
MAICNLLFTSTNLAGDTIGNLTFRVTEQATILLLIFKFFSFFLLNFSFNRLGLSFFQLIFYDLLDSSLFGLFLNNRFSLFRRDFSCRRFC